MNNGGMTSCLRQPLLHHLVQTGLFDLDSSSHGRASIFLLGFPVMHPLMHLDSWWKDERYIRAGFQFCGHAQVTYD